MASFCLGLNVNPLVIPYDVIDLGQQVPKQPPSMTHPTPPLHRHTVQIHIISMA